MTEPELKEEHIAHAAVLLRECFHCDGHTDTFSSPNYDPDQFVRGGTKLQAPLPAMREGGLDLQITALYIPPDLPGLEGAGRSLSYMGRILSACSREKGLLMVEGRDDLEQLQGSGRLGLLVDLEGADALCGDAGLLKVFHRTGVRSLGITHNASNEAGGGCRPSEGSDEGLTSFGREVVSRCEELGIVLDAAHLGRKSFRDLMDVATRPVINSHACCAAIRELDRNVTDEMLKQIAGSGGLTAITYVPYFLEPDGEGECVVDSTLVFRHIEHAAEVAGIDHVGLGSDFDGTDRLPDDVGGPRDVKRVVARMVQAGWADADIKRVAGENFRRVLLRVLR